MTQIWRVGFENPGCVALVWSVCAQTCSIKIDLRTCTRASTASSMMMTWRQSLLAHVCIKRARLESRWRPVRSSALKKESCAHVFKNAKNQKYNRIIRVLELKL